ncbi:MAG: hypothetical protein F4Y44_03025 [Chloroflexi bacterium]|nr:hypothetical protein [Chloroflexota bacterium]
MQTLDFTFKGIAIEGTIIDVETVSLSPKPNGMFTFGTFSGSTIRILQAESEADCEVLAAEVRRIWNTLPRPIYAYNRKFVEDWIGDAIGGEAHVDHDTMGAWKAVADQQSLKWPRLRELIRPPVFYYRWGIADYDRERDFGTMRRTMRSAKSVNEVISREALGGAPHIWWRQHLAMLQDMEICRQLADPPASPENTGADDRTSKIYRLPNGAWTTNRLAAIVCHNTLDLQSQASLLLWQWDITSAWL